MQKAVQNTVARGRSTADIEDLVSEVWLHLIERRVLDKADPSRGTVESLVYVAARNYTLSLLRKRRLLPTKLVSVDDQAEVLHVPGEGADPVELRLAHRDLTRVLEQFNDDDRELLALSLLHDLTAAEIVEVRGETVTEKAIEAMRKRLQRVKEDLGAALEELVSTPSPAARMSRKGAP